MAKQNKKNHQSGLVRIIAGKWRGRKMHFPDVPGLRPTTDRVRETIFNWLQGSLGDARCLDLFAGSGALGFEAASRGAEHVDLVELDNQAVNSLQENCQLLSATQCQVIKSTAQQFLSTCSGPYDVVFIDPPYQSNLWTEVANLLENNNLLSDNARIYLEWPKKQKLPDLPARWQILKDKVAGDVRYCLFTNEPGDGK